MDECYDRLVTHDDVKDLPDIPWHYDLSNFRWPRYENDEYVNFGDVLPQFADTIYKTVKNITFHEDGVIAIGNAGGSAKRTVILKPGERVERKCPRHISKDGMTLSKGMTVWLLDENGHYVREYKVVGFMDDDDVILQHLDDEDKGYAKSWELTTEKPPICVDGKPANPGDKVWKVSDNSQHTVYKIINSIKVKLEDDSTVNAYALNHTPLVSDMDGVPIWRTETLYDENGCKYLVYDFDEVGNNMYVLCYLESGQETRVISKHLSHDPFVYDANYVPTKKGDTVYEIGKSYPPLIVVGLPEPGAYRSVKVMCPSGAFTGFDPERLTHVKPEVDTWEKIEQDAYDYGGPNVSEFVLRCKKLAKGE